MYIYIHTHTYICIHIYGHLLLAGARLLDLVASPCAI